MDYGVPLGVLVLTLALLWDFALGEPPVPLHPVVWMGRIGAVLYSPIMRLPEGLQVVGGMLPPLLVGALAASIAIVADRLASSLGLWLVGVPASAFLLKSAFAVKELIKAGQEISRHLRYGQLEEARDALKALVSRDVWSLDAARIASAAVESLGENLCDSVVAPLFYYCIFGLPGALVYRTVNTLDAMFGYHGEFEKVGKATARLDDFLNLIPARFTALVLWLVDLASSGWRPLRAAWKFRRVTESPNAGWTMAAMAGALGVMLEKPGYYAIPGGEDFPGTGHIDRACKLVLRASLLTACLAVVVQIYGPAVP